MTGLRSIPWVRLVAEGAAIVVSILLAFVIDAAWDVRGELQEEREMLEGLRAEFEDVKRRLDTWVDFNRAQAALIDRALDPAAPPLSATAVDSLISGIPMINVLDRGGGPLDAVLSSGRLELIRDPELREAVARWPDRMEDLHTNDLTFRDFVWNNVVPHMASRSVPDGRCVRDGFYCLHGSGAPPAYRALLGEGPFRAFLSLQRGLHRLVARDQERASTTAAALMRAIDGYLGR